MFNIKEQKKQQRVWRIKWMHRKLVHTRGLCFNSKSLTFKTWSCLLTLSSRGKKKVKEKISPGLEQKIMLKQIELYILLTVQMIHKYTGWQRLVCPCSSLRSTLHGSVGQWNSMHLEFPKKKKTWAQILLKAFLWGNGSFTCQKHF